MTDHTGEISAWRSSPLTSKTMWTIYVGQLSLAVLAWQVVAVMRERTPTSVLLALIGAIAAVAITGVAGLAWTDPAVAAVRLIKSAPPQAAIAVAVSSPAPPPDGESDALSKPILARALEKIVSRSPPLPAPASPSETPPKEAP